MSQPNSREEYDARFAANNRIEGYGLDTSPVYPCPFCAASDWARHRLLEMEAVMARPHTCGECGRSAKMVFVRESQGVSFEVVQTGGPDQPEWLQPRMRRVDN